uniref:Acylneuraminate cytidylyltransferase family protein n=1 Tax=Fundidesulfovibrio putealis TaxID=270496 RepID=A0A7C4AH39_9BACT
MSAHGRMVALIPARGGSKRVPGKNTALLAGHPLLAYSVRAALDSGVFAAVVASTESPEIAAVAARHGAAVPFLRPAEYAGDLSPDLDWVVHALTALAAGGDTFDSFAILRPTSPFRLPETIRRAKALFDADPAADSLRAVQPCREHPGKMWVERGGRLLPLMPFATERQPWHSSPYQALPRVYVQNASLEMAHVRVPLTRGTIAGEVVLPFVTQGHEGFDINSPEDLETARALAASGRARLPHVPQPPDVSDTEVRP